MPISPSEVVAKKREVFPAEVLEVWDRLIAEAWDGYLSSIRQDTAIDALLSCTTLGTRAEVVANKWLDVEDIYRASGWKVKYDKPGYNESYEAYFEFSAKK